MNRDSRLSVVLHVLLHMLAFDGPVTSEALAAAFALNPVVIRRTMAGLRNAGFVRSEKGHGGGWTIACDPRKTTMLDIYRALGEPQLFAMGLRSDSPDCLVEQAVNATMKNAYRDAEQLLRNRFSQATLASLAMEFKRSYKTKRCM